MRQEHAQNGRLERVQARVVPDVLKRLLVTRAMEAQRPGGVGDVVVVGDDRPAVRGGGAASAATGSPSSLRSGAGSPKRSTETMAVVRAVSAARTVSTVTLRVSKSTSQNTGRAPALTTASALA